MGVTIRLARYGKKGYAVYRVVVLDKRKKRDGAYLEKIGIYNPNTDPLSFSLVKERFDYWISKGATISEGLQKLLKFKKD